MQREFYYKNRDQKYARVNKIFFLKYLEFIQKKNCYEMKDAFVVLFVSVQTPTGFADQAPMKTAVTEA